MTFDQPTPVDLDTVARVLHEVRNDPHALGPDAVQLVHTLVPAMIAEIEWARQRVETLEGLRARPLWFCQGGEMVQITDLDAWLGRDDGPTA